MKGSSRVFLQLPALSCGTTGSHRPHVSRPGYTLHVIRAVSEEAKSSGRIASMDPSVEIYSWQSTVKSFVPQLVLKTYPDVDAKYTYDP